MVNNFLIKNIKKKKLLINIMEHNVSILIITCSLYENIWEPFFKCLKNKWPDNKYKIYIGCDKYVDKSKYPGKNFIITNIEPYSSNYNNRVKDFLKQIKTKYVLLFQDDLLITSQIKTNDINLTYNLIIYTQINIIQKREGQHYVPT